MRNLFALSGLALGFDVDGTLVQSLEKLQNSTKTSHSMLCSIKAFRSIYLAAYLLWINDLLHVKKIGFNFCLKHT